MGLSLCESKAKFGHLSEYGQLKKAYEMGMRDFLDIIEKNLPMINGYL